MSHRLFIAVMCAGALACGARAAAADDAPAPAPVPAVSTSSAPIAAPVSAPAAVVAAGESLMTVPSLGWWSIAEMVAARSGVHAAPRPEIQPWFVSPLEMTHTLEFRGAVPNPFRSETAIRFTLPSEAHVSLRVYDVAGKLVRNLVDAQLPPGDHSALFSGRDLRSGMYFAVLRVGGVQVSRGVVLAR